MNHIETMKQALEALIELTGWQSLAPGCVWDEAEAAITTLRTAIDVAEKLEPIYQMQMMDGKWIDQSKQRYEYNKAKGHTVRIVYTTSPAAPVQEPLTWHEGSPPFPQDQEWFIAETIYGDRVVLRSLDEGREHKGNYAFKTADQTYMKQEIVKRWMQFPDCGYLPPAAPVQDELAYRAAVSLATWLFKKHFAHEEHYASGRVVWEPCDTTAGVISQIDNMVCGLVQPAATVKESLTVQPAAPVQEPVAYRSRMRNRDGQVITGWVVHTDTSENPDPRIEIEPLYTTPPGGRQSEELRSEEDCLSNVATPLAAQRQSALRAWVGLTDDDLEDACPDSSTPMSLGEAFVAYGRAVEAKLKEKNGGNHG